MPQERFSQAPTPTAYPLNKNSNNDYQMGPRISEFHPMTVDTAKLVQELLQRVEKLEAKNDKWERLEMRVDRIEGNHLKLESKMGSFGSVKEREPRGGKENQSLLENRLSEQEMNLKDKQDLKEFKLKEREKGRLEPELVTKEELQKQLLGLNGAFKTLFSTFKTTINTEVGEYNLKNKKKFIQITASQLS